MCDSIPLQLPIITINNTEIRRKHFDKFPGVIIEKT